jgi:ABC-2 type transport system permease protein
MKYLLFFNNSIKATLYKKGEIIGRLIAYCVIFFLYKQIVESTSGSWDRIAYISATQWVIFSGGSTAFDIAKDVETKQIHYFLLEPYNYLLAKFMESIASSFVKFVAIGLLCIMFTQRFSLMAVILIIFAIILYNLLGILIGLLAFYMQDIKQVFYLNLTACFAFGGLIVPLNFYSPFMQKIAFLTPYPYILSLPASCFSGDNIQYFAGFFMWCVIIIFAIKLLYKKICYAL